MNPSVDATSAPSVVRAPSGVNPRRVQRVAASRPRTSGTATNVSKIPASGLISQSGRGVNGLFAYDASCSAANIGNKRNATYEP